MIHDDEVLCNWNWKWIQVFPSLQFITRDLSSFDATQYLALSLSFSLSFSHLFVLLAQLVSDCAWEGVCASWWVENRFIVYFVNSDLERNVNIWETRALISTKATNAKMNGRYLATPLSNRTDSIRFAWNVRAGSLTIYFSRFSLNFLGSVVDKRPPQPQLHIRQRQYVTSSFW